jgi:hypothetical protein
MRESSRPTISVESLFQPEIILVARIGAGEVKH